MKKDINAMLEMARECELKAEEAYSHFAEKFAYSHDAHKFWDALSSDEKEHAAIICAISRELETEQKAMEPEYSQWYPMEKLLMYVSANPFNKIDSIREAYEYTEKIENYEVTSIVQLLAKEYMPDDQRSELLHKQLDVHYKMIEDFKKKTTKEKSI